MPKQNIFSLAIRIVFVVMCIFVFSFGLLGCRGKDTEQINALLPASAEQINSIAECQAVPLWLKNVQTLRCTLLVKNNGKNPLGVELLGIYRKSKDGGSQFVVLMPQGIKLGQCTQLGTNISYQIGKIPYSKKIVQNSFEAFLALANIAPAIEDEHGINQSLQIERNGKSAFEIYKVVNSKEGYPFLANGKHIQDRNNWNITFAAVNNEGIIDNFSYKPDSAWSVDVKIQAVVYDDK